MSAAKTRNPFLFGTPPGMRPVMACDMPEPVRPFIYYIDAARVTVPEEIRAGAEDVFRSAVACMTANVAHAGVFLEDETFVVVQYRLPNSVDDFENPDDEFDVQIWPAYGSFLGRVAAAAAMVTNMNQASAIIGAGCTLREDGSDLRRGLLVAFVTANGCARVELFEFVSEHRLKPVATVANGVWFDAMLALKLEISEAVGVSPDAIGVGFAHMHGEDTGEIVGVYGTDGEYRLLEADSRASGDIPDDLLLSVGAAATSGMEES